MSEFIKVISLDADTGLFEEMNVHEDCFYDLETNNNTNENQFVECQSLLAREINLISETLKYKNLVVPQSRSISRESSVINSTNPFNQEIITGSTIINSSQVSTDSNISNFIFDYEDDIIRLERINVIQMSFFLHLTTILKILIDSSLNAKF
jgi:hypothetical protein